ncbi:UDP-N-acetylmuramoyl-L-alanyl-D-glutamate--2,6-diaminopimelate ligase [Deinococcus cellulosilyticus]|uniref:UDP-N-acetylmuramyl-tripeptide synthetase n=1 Tax=Deinococcus cellulosilyticus (strain DSM 18568 / NBRC 106333 / KACC 11606 / 5516J-15) TaxID=1223518 RepID=A0A511MYL3_DEIC1|nr:UDP-N-acetylmuramoyl-L-alanyl-D-glutamate--2,6-diaminopimelate ligase [Deinococcus cellulosilyticus]GEM45378.1 UDP-N-acetylmuramyl-tripeptide synthetase [Deinococcus cellulosilyticus NBRC 106333 = KACC 11606]
MKLHDLLLSLNLPLPAENPDVTAVTHNSAWVKPGAIFVAVRGLKTDGHKFIPQALERGAVAVVGEGFEGDLPVPYLQVNSARHALADLACVLQNHPSRELQVVGITGTDGKSTTSWITYHLLQAAGKASGLLSTVGYKTPDGVLHHFPQHLTTPDSPEIQSLLRELVSLGTTHCVLETSSHALELERVRGVQYQVGIFTNLTPEHLDFHGDMEGYFQAKRKLIDRSHFAVLNQDDPYARRLTDHPNHTTFGVSPDAQWRAINIEEEVSGLKFTVVSPAGTFDVVLPMIGQFNVHNALAAIAAAHHLGIEIPVLQQGLASFEGVPGRMQILSSTPRVIVDFAHTPPSLEKALEVLRPSTPGKLWVVVGSAGGNRDPLKRAPLGEVASRLADQAIFTEEDCRDTPIEEILREMERGASALDKNNFKSIADRREAIRFAVQHAADADTVLLAGKGPEDTLERATEILPWNEVEEALQALSL